MDRLFDLDEARTLTAEARRVADALIPVRAELAERMHRQQAYGDGGLPELKALQARMAELLDWFPQRGIQVKGYAPLLIDFPHRRGDRDLLLCWLEGEAELQWYHDVAHGFMGRRPLRELGSR